MTGPRVFPATHIGLAAYWGEEAAMAMSAVRPGAEHIQWNEEHAYRCARIAWTHAIKAMPKDKETA